MKVSLLETRSDGYKAFCIIFTKEEVTDMEKLRDFRSMETVEKTIEGCLEVELEMMY